MSSNKPVIRRGVGVPKPPAMGRKRLYDFSKLEVGDAMDCDASYGTIHCSVARYKKKSPKQDFVISVITKDPAKTRVTRSK